MNSFPNNLSQAACWLVPFDGRNSTPPVDSVKSVKCHPIKCCRLTCAFVLSKSVSDRCRCCLESNSSLLSSGTFPWNLTKPMIGNTFDALLLLGLRGASLLLFETDGASILDGVARTTAIWLPCCTALTLKSLTNINSLCSTALASIRWCTRTARSTWCGKFETPPAAPTGPITFTGFADFIISISDCWGAFLLLDSASISPKVTKDQWVRSPPQKLENMKSCWVWSWSWCQTNEWFKGLNYKTIITYIDNFKILIWIAIVPHCRNPSSFICSVYL